MCIERLWDGLDKSSFEYVEGTCLSANLSTTNAM
jgi:hypothetical protein